MQMEKHIMKYPIQNNQKQKNKALIENDFDNKYILGKKLSDINKSNNIIKS